MFEKFDMQAKRAIFFARDEATISGSASVEIGHLLLRLKRASSKEVEEFLLSNSIKETMEEHVKKLIVASKKTPTDVSLPVSNDVKEVLNFAWREANVVGIEHLLLGLLHWS